MKYKAILADPPWGYLAYNSKKNPLTLPQKKRAGNGLADRHYPVMTGIEISRLPVADLADKDCCLFLWATWPCLNEALEVGKAWGFTYSTAAFVWTKTSKSRGNSFLLANSGWHYGLGFATRANTEPCLLFRKGKLNRKDKGVAQLIVAPVGKHSAKPLETHERIERLVEGPYLELFARNKARAGWDYWGNEIENDIELGSTAAANEI